MEMSFSGRKTSRSVILSAAIYDHSNFYTKTKNQFISLKQNEKYYFTGRNKVRYPGLTNRHDSNISNTKTIKLK